MRRKIIVFLVLFFALIIFAYARKEIFLQQAKKLIKQNLEKSLPCELSIGKIKAGLFYGLVLENLELHFPQISGLAFNIKVEQTLVDYNLWQNVFSGHKDVNTLKLISPDINLSYPSSPAANFALSPNWQGERPGFVPEEFMLVAEGGRISFGQGQVQLLKDLQGKLLFRQKGLYFQDISATFKNSPEKALRIYGDFTEERLSLTANLEHLKIGDFDILTNYAFSLDKKLNLQDKNPKVYGTLKTYGSVLNNRPFPELSSSFEIQDDRLRILSFSFGDSYDLRGIVDLQAPFNADLSLNFYQAAPNELIAQFAAQLPAESGMGFREPPDFSGLLNGLIKITGELGRPKVEGYLEAREGHIGDLNFVSADINIKGRYPKFSIVDSRIYREEDFFIVEGEIDFTDLEQQELLDIRLRSDQGILWQGWDITRSRENQVHLSKSIADDLKITFDSFIDIESAGFQDNYTNELGLEYKIFGDKLLKLRLRREEEILGVERRIKF